MMSAWFRRKPPPEEEPARLVWQGPGDERRRAYRQESEIGAIVMSPQGDYGITVLNVSPTGLCFAGRDKIAPGQEVCVRFTTPGDRTITHHIVVRGKCQWISASARKDEPWLCGLHFNPMALSEHLGLIRFFLEHFSLRFAAPGDKRRQIRLGFDRDVRVTVFLEAQARAIDGTVFDISVDGISILCNEKIEVATKLSLSLRAGTRANLALRGQVVHTRKKGESRYQMGIVTHLTTDGDRTMLTDILTAAGREIFDDTGRPLPPREEKEEAPTKEVTPWRPTVNREVSADRTDFLDLYGLDSGRAHKGEKKDEGWRPPWERK